MLTDTQTADTSDQATVQIKNETVTTNVGGIAGERLKSFIERVERLETEKKVITEDIKEVYADAKTTGFEPRIIRKIVSLRKIEVEKRREDAELLDLYATAIGMQLELGI